jgi:hypothetical protein
MIKDMTEEEILGILMDKDKEVEFRKQWFEEFIQQQIHSMTSRRISKSILLIQY